MSTNKAADQLTDSVSSVTGSTEKVERIREIILGPQLREFGQKLENMQRDLAILSREVERLQRQVREQEQGLKKQVNEEAERLTRKLQEHEHAQDAQLEELGKQQNHDLQLLDQKHLERSQRLDSQLQTSSREIASRLRELAEQINLAKVDRTLLGDLLVELGTRLQTHVAAAPVDAEDELISRLSEELG